MSNTDNKPDIMSYESSIWSTADILRGVSIKKGQWPEFMMPMFALLMVESRIKRHFNELIESNNGSKDMAIEELKEEVEDARTGISNTYGYNSILVEDGKSLYDVASTDTNFDAEFERYLEAFDDETRDLLGINPREGDNKLDIRKYLKILDDKNVKFDYVQAWASIDFTNYNNSEITTLEEHIKRKWADLAGEDSAEQYTPSDIIALISDITTSYLEQYDKDINLKIYDMTCGGGNMLFGVEDNIERTYNQKGKKSPYMITYGQEYETSLYALAKIESRFRTESHIGYGNTLTQDQFPDTKMNIIVANPPYGTDWKHEKKAIEADETGRFVYKPGIGDGQMLFLQHAIAKMEDRDDQLSIGCIVLNGSPLFSGDANSGESNIRRWILENDYLEALIQLPDSEFFNTNITTYIWVLNKNKREALKNKVKLIDASEMFTKMRRSKGKKNKELLEESRASIIQYLMDESFEVNDQYKVFDTSDFFYNKQKIKLIHVDVHGNSAKNKTGVVCNYSFGDSEIDNTVAEMLKNDEMLDLKTLEKNINDFIKNLDKGNLSISTKDGQYFFDEEKESIAFKSFDDNKEAFLGNGILSIKAKYTKGTKKKEESFELVFDISPKVENDYEITPFSFDDNENEQLIDDFLGEWVENQYEKLDNSVGVEINFSKVFYKPEINKSIEQIQRDIQACDQSIQKLMNKVFTI